MATFKLKFIRALITTFLLVPFLAQAVLYPFQDKSSGLYGLKDAKGKLVVSPKFEQIYVPDHAKGVFSSDNKEFEFLVPVLKDGHIWRIAPDGAMRFETVFFDNGPDYYAEDLSRFLKNKKVGFHDMGGYVVIQPEYDFASPFKDGYAAVCNGCYAQYPRNPIYAPLTSNVWRHRMLEEMYLNIVGGKWGLIDKSGKVIIPMAHASYEEMLKHLKPSKP